MVIGSQVVCTLTTSFSQNSDLISLIFHYGDGSYPYIQYITQGTIIISYTYLTIGTFTMSIIITKASSSSIAATQNIDVIGKSRGFKLIFCTVFEVPLY